MHFLTFLAHVKSKKHKRTYGLLRKQQKQTVRILTERQRHLSASQSDSESNEINETDMNIFNEELDTAAS